MALSYFVDGHKKMERQLGCAIYKSQLEFDNLILPGINLIKIAYHIRAVQNRFRNLSTFSYENNHELIDKMIFFQNQTRNNFEKIHMLIMRLRINDFLSGKNMLPL